MGCYDSLWLKTLLCNFSRFILNSDERCRAWSTLINLVHGMQSNQNLIIISSTPRVPHGGMPVICNSSRQKPYVNWRAHNVITLWRFGSLRLWFYIIAKFKRTIERQNNNLSLLSTHNKRTCSIKSKVNTIKCNLVDFAIKIMWWMKHYNNIMALQMMKKEITKYTRNKENTHTKI